MDNIYNQNTAIRFSTDDIPISFENIVLVPLSLLQWQVCPDSD